MTHGVGSVGARRLLAAFGPPTAVFAQPVTVLRQVVNASQAQALCEVPTDWVKQCEVTDRWLAGSDARRMLTLEDADYPNDLLQISDPPLILYAQGNLSLLRNECRIAMVGSRNPSAQGRQTAKDFARALSEQGICIVSGMALGIDGAAHEGALLASGSTIAVVGTGLDRVYPRKHLELAHRIADQGLLLSEYHLGVPPVASNFPKRNRIIAGLTQGTLVVEAALASGSLITARCAAEMGRDVMAIPGSIHSPQSKGCHALIRQGAKLVETAQDVLEELRRPSISGTRMSAGTDPFSDDCAGLDGGATGNQNLLEALGYDPTGFDALQARCGMPTPELQAALLDLELDGHIARLPGGLFQRVCSS